MVDALETFFREYARAFDAERVASFLHCPCLLVNARGAASLTSPSQIVANMRAVLEQQRRSGYVRAVVLGLEVQPQAPNLALARVTWRVDGADGTALWQWRNDYQLADHGAGWKILVSTTLGGD